jgi:DNA-binding winged helix-turn-helix (wHTH) protein
MPKVQVDQLLRFGPYRLDPPSGQLWRGTLEVKLTPKALAVLRHLLQQPGQVVSKEEFFRAVWPDTVVSDAALTSCIQELRQALHDDARSPRYIETVYRRGFRFIAQLTTITPPVQSLKSKVQSQHSAFRTPHSAINLVGREAELQHLHSWFEKALRGKRQLIFVTGEPGIGKTTLVEAFLAQVAGNGTAWIGRGQCIEHYGAGEAYLPLLEALGRLGRESEGERFIQLLSQYASTWLVQMPALLSAADLEALQRKTAGATRERMLRELTEAIEVVTRER